MMVAEALDFPEAVTQGFDLLDVRLMIASALEDLAQVLLEERRARNSAFSGGNTRTSTVGIVGVGLNQANSHTSV
jgi:hypothetical protein